MYLSISLYFIELFEQKKCWIPVKYYDLKLKIIITKSFELFIDIHQSDTFKV